MSSEAPIGIGAGVRTLALISCVKDKLPYPAPAVEIYRGFFFASSLRYARSLGPDAIYILSGKYGLLALEDPVEPYDLNLGEQPQAYRETWSQRVLAALGQVSRPAVDHYILLVEPPYRDGLVPHLGHVSIPFAGLSLVEQEDRYRAWYGSAHP